MNGKTISHYRIIEKIGEGGMGVVYKAQDTRLDRVVAIKFLSSSLLSTPTAKERFLREARTTSRLDHPNIITIHEVDETPDGDLFIVMAYYEGETLRDLISRQRLSIDRIVDLTVQIARGLAKAHDEGILHRDIKPENIFLTADGHVKILDFGLARLTDETRVTREGTTVGTVRYMAPEQITGGTVDRRSDIFSLGVMLYEMLAGEAPFQGDRDAAVIYSITNAAPKPIDRDDVPAEVMAVLNDALEKDPEKRLSSASAFADRLRSFEPATSTSARTETLTPVLEDASSGGRASRRAGRQRRRRSPWIVAVILVMLVVVFGPRLLERERGGSPVTSNRVAQAPPRVTLKQFTFESGVEEFPAFSPDGASLAYCAPVGGFRQVFVRDIVTGETDQITNEGRDHIQVAWGAGGDLYFVRAQSDGATLEPGDVFGIYSGGDIWRYDLNASEGRLLIADGFNPAESPDGESIAFDADTRGGRHVMVANALGHNARQVTTGESERVSYYRPRWSPDGTRIAFQVQASTQFDIAVVDVRTQQMAAITNDAAIDINPVWDPSGKTIYFSSSRTGGVNVWRIPMAAHGAAGAARQVTAGAGMDVQLAISPDGKAMAMTIMNINADLWKLPVSPQTGQPTGPPEAFIATTREDSRGSWSPDQKQVAFNSDRGGEMNIWIAKVTDGATRQLTEGPGGDYQPQWAPDGEHLVFFSSRAGNADIWEVDVRSGDLTQLTTHEGIDINPFYSPDGNYIAWQSDNGGRNEVWVMRSDGTEAKQISTTGILAHFTLWSADSKAVLFRTTYDDIAQVVSVSIDTGDVTGLGPVRGGSHMSFSPDRRLIMDVSGHEVLWVTTLGSGESRKVFSFSDNTRIDYPRWSPDGRWILFDAVRSHGGDIWLVEGF